MDYAKIISAAARDMRPSGIRKFFDIAAEMRQKERICLCSPT